MKKCWDLVPGSHTLLSKVKIDLGRGGCNRIIGKLNENIAQHNNLSQLEHSSVRTNNSSQHSLGDTLFVLNTSTNKAYLQVLILYIPLKWELSRF